MRGALQRCIGKVRGGLRWCIGKVRGEMKHVAVLWLGLSFLVILCSWAVNFTRSSQSLPSPLPSAGLDSSWMARGGWSWVFLFLRARQVLRKPHGLSGGKIVSPEGKPCSENSVLCCISRLFLLPSLCWNSLIFSDFPCDDLVEFLEVQLTEVWVPCYDWVPVEFCFCSFNYWNFPHWTSSNLSIEVQVFLTQRLVLSKVLL